MKIFSKKKSIVSPAVSRSSARPKIHNAVVAKKTTRKTKEMVEKETKKKEGKKTRVSFTKALSAFFSKKKKPYSPLEEVKKTPETKILDESPAVLPEKQVEVKIRTSRFRLRFILPFALPIGVLAIMPWTPWFSEHAAVIKLYPATCLGGWENPKNAEGAPTLLPKSSPEQFNDRNSAVLRNSLAQIFCSDFADAFLPDAFPKKMFLKFSWATIAPAAAHTLAIPTNKAPVENPSTLSVEPLIVTEEASSTASSTISVTSTSSKKTVIDPKPVSFLEKLLNVAFAESASGTPAIASTTVEQQQDGYVSAPTKEENVSPEEEKPKVGGADFLQVLYTLDGQNWKQLGMVTRENLADLSFQVPVSDPEALAHFQVSIQNVISLDDPPVIYLDGMWLEAGE